MLSEGLESDILEAIIDPRLGPVARRVLEAERLSAADGLLLTETPDLLTVGRLATVARRRHNGLTTWYVVNQHINYSNVCKNRCKFCAFSRSPGADGAYTMTVDEVVAEARQAGADGATELHIVGGLHPELPLDYYVEMLGSLTELLPEIHLQAFTAVEIAHLATRAGLTVRRVLAILREAGLGSLPGGGAEVFQQRVRSELCPEKLPGDQWLQVMAEAHELGIPSNATMLYGHIETAAETIDHMLRLRELQDRTGGFMSFIPLAFHPLNTELARTGRTRPGGTTGYEDLRALAVGRLMLENFPHVKAFWIMLGPDLAQLSQHFGADDIDGTVVQERITHAAGAATPQALGVEEIEAMIIGAGYQPQERNTIYRRVIREGRSWRLK